jgi:cytochrome c oxidase subunit 1
VVTLDHKRLGILYILYSTFFLLVPGAEALLMRIQLAFPRNHVLSAQVYNRFFTMHGTTMVFMVGMPFLFGFANYIVPLQIGARDMAFPRLNAKFLAYRIRRTAVVLQFSRWRRFVRR